MVDYFISCNQADMHWAEWISQTLDSFGLSSSVYTPSVQHAGEFVLDLQRHVSRAKRTLVLLSTDYLTHELIYPQWQSEVEKAMARDDRSITPIRIRKCLLPASLAGNGLVDMVGKSESQWIELLASLADIAENQPAQQPDFLTEDQLARADKTFPGTWPACWNVPFSIDGQPTIPEELFSKLDSALEHAGSAVSVCRATGAPEGCGKTSLIIEYAYARKEQFDAVWWLRADTRSSLEDDLAALGERLGLTPHFETNISTKLEKTKQWLADTPTWLLIADNAPDARSVLQFLPEQFRGKVIITSPKADATLPSVMVGALDFEAADLMFDAFCPEIAQKQRQEIILLLDRHPLSLRLAASCLRESAMPPDEYLARFHARRKLRQSIEERDWLFITSLELTLDELRRQHPIANDFLECCAFMSENAIPQASFAGFAKISGLPRQLGEFSEIRSTLSSFALAKLSVDGLILHPMVQEGIRLVITPERRREVVSLAMQMLQASCPSDTFDIRLWAIFSHIVPHLTATAAHACRLDANLRLASELFHIAGTYLLGTSRYEAARECFEKALLADERRLGPAHPDLAVRLQSLGSVNERLGERERAVQIYTRAMDILTAYPGEHPEWFAQIMTSLGDIRAGLGQASEAISLYSHALETEQDRSAGPSPRIAELNTRLGSMFEQVEVPGKAMGFYIHALEHNLVLYGPSHQNVLDLVKRIVIIGCAGLPEDEGLDRHEKLRAILAKTLGPGHELTELAMDLLEKRKIELMSDNPDRVCPEP